MDSPVLYNSFLTICFVFNGTLTFRVLVQPPQ